ncbi:hypothetical protein I552_4956 [Mycobacterium xenopi 3993]|nr:hypothetical protein I552_4956 [Mycobacterium xenopi 3993]
MSEQTVPGLGRRELLGISVVATGGLALAACGRRSSEPNAPQQEAPVTPPEDLMREHGVLKRVLLIYREAIRRLEAGEPIPAQPLAAGPASFAISSRIITSTSKSSTCFPDSNRLANSPTSLRFCAPSTSVAAR